MKRVRTSLMLGVLLLFCLTIPVASQTDLEKVLSQYNSETVKGYVQPLADMFGANMQAGFYHSAAIPKSGFHFSFGLIGMGSLLGDKQKTYDAPLPAGWTPTTFNTATIFGEKGTTVTRADGLSYKGSDGIFKLSMFPLAVPQITIGAVQGTEVSFRFIPIPKVNDKIPSGSLWGIGARHSISQYFNKSPVDIAGGVFYSSFTFGDIIDFKGFSIGAQASKEFSVLILYSGLAYEHTKMNLSFKTSDPTVPVQVDMNLVGANNFRFTVGAGLGFGFFHLFADANFGSVTNFSAGIGLGG